MPKGTPRYSDELLAEAVAASLSVSDVCRYIGTKPASGTHAHISRRIRSLGLDVSHFERAPRKWTAYDADEVLVKREAGRARASVLRRAMLEKGVPYECADCEIPPQWNGRGLAFDVDHINGDATDCRLSNLRFLCPNCHSQAPTTGRGSRIPEFRSTRAKGFITPGEEARVKAEYGPYVRGRRGRVSMDLLARKYSVSRTTVERVLSGDRRTAGGERVARRPSDTPYASD